MSRRLVWGIMGTGNIARQFAEGVRGSERGVLGSVGSRKVETAREFGEKFGVPRVYGNYEALLEDGEVEAIYVSLPNSMHHEWTIRALTAGKHVLCEKPLATNLEQAEEMFEVAKTEGRVLAEAFMYRSHPQTHAVQEVVASGRIGEVKIIRTSFCYAAKQIGGNIRFDATLAGGALMDIGCYCLSLSRLLAGEPLEMHAVGHVHESGVDDYAAGVLRFERGVIGEFQCGMVVHADNTAHIEGTKGRIEVPVPWKPLEGVFYVYDGGGELKAGAREEIRKPAGKHLYGLEADDFAGCVLDGTAVRIGREESLGNQRCLDDLRRQVGVEF